ncbi:GNAT family N-acetyltransferase [Salicibibacter cibarius]|uniref:GNAT family N-acetyltransferase n=1 Tax=Salicibibacter cibarius TaxID=2743000 RepID=A0A7T7CDP4_9BACI|nr:GNAT family N-acetyltransferase [Salicibibacter cibarius]QQK78209.1 GNAT family N-acetyltransferase [Salicibibacter cibarius]
MISVVKANQQHIEGIARVCTDGHWATYGHSKPKAYIERVVEAFYNYDRIRQEVTETSKHWGGYFVALDDGEVVGAGGGGMTGDTTGELFVLYLDPDRRNEGIGTKILDAVTIQQKEFGAIEQWVSVEKDNDMGITFYEARGFSYQYERESYGNEGEEDYISLRYYRLI